jgi:hypothetical protein
MKTITTKTGLILDIRLAELNDLKAIQKLNTKWTVSSIDKADKENGFLYCDTYKEEDLKKIIEAEEVAVATNNGQVIAYYINDNYSHLLSQYDNTINKLKEDGTILPDLKVSLRTQIVVEKEFHRMGVPSEMLSFLKPLLIPKYDLLFSIGINENPKRIAHQKAGWEIIYENDFNYYCIYDLRQNK